ncbi:MAG: elongation factor P [Spirochaetales bacterium]|nr:elongation factor P [Spirochaetales bacterium]
MKAGQIENGMFILEKGEPFLVVEREFVNPGKGSAFVRCKLKNVLTGAVLKPTYKTPDNIEEATVTEHPCQYLYNDGASFHMMDNDSYEQFEIPMSGSLEDKQLFMKDGETYTVVFWEEKAVDIKIPYKIVYEVTEAEDAVKGDTVQGATKWVTIETGLKVKVPIFIKQGERIMINTDTREYVERVNN